MKPNPGYCPADAEGKRVKVWLAHGAVGATYDDPMLPKGWAADGRGGCDWSITGSAFDIAFYEVLG